MKFTMRKTKASLEKRVLGSIIQNTEFLKQYKHIHRQGCFSVPYGDWLAQECLTYLEKFGTAPGKDIKELYRSAAKGNRINPTLADVTLDFIRGIDFESPPTINPTYLADKTKDFFILQLHRALAHRLSIALEKEDPTLCEEAVSEVKGVKLQTGQVCDVFNDKAGIREAFLKEEKPLFKLSGALGVMMNPQFKAKRMICFLGRAKSGKTWWLYKLAKIAKRYGNHVAVFAAGDEDEDASRIRFACILSGKNNDKAYTGDFALPIMDCAKNQNGECFKNCRKGKGSLPEMTKEERERMKPEQILETSPKHIVCTVCRNKAHGMFEPAIWYKKRNVALIMWQEAWRRFQRFHRFSPKASLKLFTYSSDTLTVSEMRRQLDMAEDIDGWVPTVVVLDYPDIMAPETVSAEVRHMENQKWLQLRKLSQDRSLCLILASQSNMGGYGSDSLGAGNVNEDRRKLDHVTAMYGINQTEDEKRKRIARMGPIVQRKGAFDTEYQLLVLQALEMGNPCTDSHYVFKSTKPKTDKK